MNRFISHKKAQSLPLNTIVIAILVIIVLIAIISFFVGSFSESTGSVDDTTSCSLNNGAIAALGYTDARPIEEGQTCDSLSGDYKPALGISNCCVEKKETN